MLFSTLIVSSLAPQATHALEFQCENPGDKRYIRVELPGQEHLCEVSVSYQATGERKVMWYADNDSMFCSAKAYELKDKYVDKWNFSCALWPDTDGIDQLSPMNRTILDQQLKAINSEGENAEEPFKVTHVRASSSHLLDDEPGALAIQFFLSNGNDRTQLIDNTGTKWSIRASFNNLASHVTGNAVVQLALIEAITEQGNIEVATTVFDERERVCRGKQVLAVRSSRGLTEITPHQVVCKH